MTTDREKASESGCDDYETKPIDFTRLFEKLDSLLAGKPSPLAGL
jgi:CheY-like chemotaxis protein